MNPTTRKKRISKARLAGMIEEATVDAYGESEQTTGWFTGALGGSLPQFIEHLYLKTFGRKRREVVLSVEERIRAELAKKEARREARRRART